ncbi:MAG: hypothetical protein U0531_18845 [Dehalococcoidia bacterium]
MRWRLFSAFCTARRALGSLRRVRALPPGSDLPADALLFAQRSMVYGRLGPVVVDDAQARAPRPRPRGLDEGRA